MKFYSGNACNLIMYFEFNSYFKEHISITAKTKQRKDANSY